ncbi:MAG: GNAT family N-acetyltransferase [Chloroflexota bacterium]
MEYSFTASPKNNHDNNIRPSEKQVAIFTTHLGFLLSLNHVIIESMTAVTASVLTPSAKQLRPFDVRRDLMAVANLIADCFAQSLDADGKRYVQQMRRAANNPSWLWWAALTKDDTNVPLWGFVWEEDGKIVGNLSLIPKYSLGERRYLIANVAVDSAYRRRGIARALTLAALQHLQQQHVHSVWLQVREDNLYAYSLYLSMNFQERTRRTLWHLPTKGAARKPPTDILVSPRLPSDWKKQKTWLLSAYPSEMIWCLPLDWKAIQPGLTGELYRLFTQNYPYHLSARRKDKLLGILTRQRGGSTFDYLWLAASPETESDALGALVPTIQQTPLSKQILSFDYPSGRATETLLGMGFQPQRSLIWMNYNLE